MGIHLVLDCQDPDRLAEFWAQALDLRLVGRANQYVVIGPDEGRDGPQLILQRVDEPKAGKNRMHIDIEADDVEAVATRLVAAGATRVGEAPVEELGMRWVQMADPEGNEFDVCQPLPSGDG